VTTVERVFRDQWGRVLAAMVAYLGDLDLAEDVAQEAFAIAAERWPRDGDPEHPVAWLVTTARNRAINRVRRDRTLAAKARLLRGSSPCSHADAHDEQHDERNRTRIPTSGWSSCSCAVIRPFRSTPRCH
jgi:RNA polymerase sigma-70 factor (ECF subfamily)